MNDQDHPSTSQAPQGQPIPVYMAQPPKQRSLLGRFVRWLLRTVLMVVVFFFVIAFVLGALSGVIPLDEQVIPREYAAGNDMQRIALIDLAGPITMETPETVRRMLAAAAKDETVRGVILVVNSPGGQVVPSEMIHGYVADFREDAEKPIYACIEQLGASGAYWAATAAERIYAQTNSVVGSIGVIYISMVIEDTLKEKLGMDPIVIKSRKAEFKDRGSIFRQPTEEEMEEIKDDLDRVHERFVDVVATSRLMSDEEAWALAQGEIYDGPEALDHRLIDGEGTLDDVIETMAGDLFLLDPQVIRYEEAPTLRDLLAAQAQSRSATFDIKGAIDDFTGASGIMALYPGR